MNNNEIIPIGKPKATDKKILQPTTLPLHINPKQGQSGFGVGVKVQIDGQTVDEFESESFFPMFYQILEAMMHGGRKKRTIMWLIYNNDKNITDIFSSGTTLGVQLDNSFYYGPSFGNSNFVGTKVGISGVKGIGLNGSYRVRSVLDTGDTFPERFELENLDGSDITLDPALWTAGSGKIDSFSVELDNTFIERLDNDSYRAIRNSQVWDVIVGQSSGAEDFSEIWLQDRIMNGAAEGELQHTGVSFTAQTTDKPSSGFTMIRSFQNPAANIGDVAVTEYGIISYLTDRNEAELKSLLSRDVRSAKTVSPGSQLSVQLTPKVVLVPDTQDTQLDGTNGGFLDAFMTLLRNLATESFFEENRNNYFQLANPPGGGIMWDDYQERNHERFGMVVGTDSTYVSMTDDGILAPVLHGSKDNTLYHWGTDVGDLQVAPDPTGVNNKAFFEITRFFENRGATAITIKEVGLNCNSSSGGLSGPYPIARFALDSADEITINPGEIKPIVMTVGKG